MAQTFFYNQDGSVEDLNGWLDFRIGPARLILGRRTGKFGHRQQSYYPASKGAILLDCSFNQLMLVAMNVPHLNTILSRGAQLFSMMEIKHLDNNGEEVPNSKVLKFLKQPNPLQSQEAYMYQYYIMNGVYNKTIQYKITAFSNPALERIPVAMWLLPTGSVKINVTGKLYRQTKVEEIIESFEIENGVGAGIYEANKIIYLSEGVGTDPLNPVSRIESNQIPLSNIVASLKSNNIIITERGMIGFISPAQPKDPDGVLPLTSEQHKQVRKEFQEQYSLDSDGGHVAFPGMPMEWHSMTLDVKQLGLNETTEDAFGQLCNAYGHDRDLYSSTKGATFENKAAGVKATIQLGLQPIADNLMRTLTKHLIDESTGEYLSACYEHLPAMKEDERLAAQGKLYKAQSTDILLKNGTISHDQAALINEVENDGTNEIMQSSAPAYGNEKPPADEK